MDLFLFAKSIHIISIVTWFAGLFYIVRLFIYHVEANEKPKAEKEVLQNQFKIMERRLWNIITVPSAVVVGITGSYLTTFFTPFSEETWLHGKIFFIILLYLYHHKCGRILKTISKDPTKYTGKYLRVFNEVATLLLFAIIFLVEMKDFLNMGLGILSLFALATALMIGIKVYQKNRK